MSIRSLSPIVGLAMLAAAPAFAATGPAPSATAWNGGSDTYRANLLSCVARSGPCDRGLLSQDDRDYLTYEMRSQRFDRRTAEQVVDVRMEYYGREVPVIQGHATGTRYPSTTPASAPAEGGGIIGLRDGASADLGKLVPALAKGIGSLVN